MTDSEIAAVMASLTSEQEKGLQAIGDGKPPKTPDELRVFGQLRRKGLVEAPPGARRGLSDEEAIAEWEAMDTHRRRVIRTVVAVGLGNPIPVRDKENEGKYFPTPMVMELAEILVRLGIFDQDKSASVS